MKAARGWKALLVAGLLATMAPTAASATPAGSGKGQMPDEAKVARVVEGQTPTVEISKAEFLAGAQKEGKVLTETQRAEVAAATSCWRWDAWRLGENIVGVDLWKSHHRVNWCGDGSWIRSHAYTERWGETFFPGWKDKGLTQSGQRYGVNWNQYQSWTQRKFCYVEYFSCIQEANPYHNTTVWPNGAGQWN